MRKLLQWFRRCLRRFGGLEPSISLSIRRRGEIRRIRFGPSDIPDGVAPELAQAVRACLDANAGRIEQHLEELDSRVAEQGHLLTAALVGDNRALAEALCGTGTGAESADKRQPTECVTWKNRT